MNVATIMQTIQVIIAPVVMVTACAILLGSVQGRYMVINDRLRAMTGERLDLLRRPDSNQLALPEPSDAYRMERLAQIDAQVPSLLRRHGMIRDAILALYGAIGIFILTMFAIAGALAVTSSWIGWLALVLFLMGTGAILTGVAITTVEVRLSNAALQFEVNRVMNLGR